eukprot:9499969-Pyramimonas_sp.AAC.1
MPHAAWSWAWGSSNLGRHSGSVGALGRSRGWSPLSARRQGVGAPIGVGPLDRRRPRGWRGPGGDGRARRPRQGRPQPLRPELLPRCPLPE